LTPITRRTFLRSAAAGAAGAAAAAAALGGCSRREGDDVDPDGRIVLHFYSYAGQSFLQLYTDWLIPEFERTHPHIRVKLNTNLGEAGYDTKLLTLIAGGLAPDVFHVTQTNFPLYASKDVLMPLDSIAASDSSFRLGDLYPRVVDGMRYRGALLGLPSDFSTIVMMYNRDHFSAAGVPTPPDDWTWDDYLDVSRRLTRAPQQFGTATTNAYNRWPAWVWMNGGDLFDAGVTRCTMDEPAAIEGLQFYVDLALRHRVAASPGYDLGLNDGELFMARRVGIYAASRYSYKQYLHTRPLKFAFDLAPMPRGPAGRFTTFIWGGNCMMKSTRRPKESWEFLKFLSDARGATLTVDSGNALPPHRATAVAAVAKATHPKTPTRDRLFLEAIDYGRQAPFPSRYAEYNTALVGIADTFGGLTPVEQACRQFAREVNGLLAREQS
jgi:multiple sugar transport system substrate-binding protein